MCCFALGFLRWMHCYIAISLSQDKIMPKQKGFGFLMCDHRKVFSLQRYENDFSDIQNITGRVKAILISVVNSGSNCQRWLLFSSLERSTLEALIFLHSDPWQCPLAYHDEIWPENIQILIQHKCTVSVLLFFKWQTFQCGSYLDIVQRNSIDCWYHCC